MFSGTLVKSRSVEEKSHSDTGASSSAESEKHPGFPDETIRARKSPAGKLCDTKIFVVWLESFEDSFNFPAGMLFTVASLRCTYPFSKRYERPPIL
jgi:hypothetical protein